MLLSKKRKRDLELFENFSFFVLSENLGLGKSHDCEVQDSEAVVNGDVDVLGKFD